MNPSTFVESIRLPPELFCEKAHIDRDDWARAVLQQGDAYLRFTVPKRSGGERVVHSPRKSLKRLQRQLGAILERWYFLRVPQGVYGFIPAEYPDLFGRTRDVVSNAERHLQAEYLLNIDIDDFFPSISVDYMRKRWLEEWPYTHSRLLDELMLILTYEGSLPTGAPSSPILSNLLALPIDEDMEAFAKTHGLVYTRYVDDLSISTDTEWQDWWEEAIGDCIDRHGFNLNAKKRKLFTPPDEKVVTGVRFDGEVGLKLNVEKRIVSNFRRCLRSYDRHRWWEEVNGRSPWIRHKLRFLANSIEGQLAFVRRVEGDSSELVKRLEAEWATSHQEKNYYLDGYHRIW